MDYSEDFSNLHFEAPFTTVILGKSKTGKTTLVRKIVEEWDDLVYHPTSPLPIWQLIIVFEHDQDAYTSIICAVQTAYPDCIVKCMRGWNEREMADSKLYKGPDSAQTLLIVDDCLHSLSKSETIGKICRGTSHHDNVSAFLILQDVTSVGRDLRSALKNIDYFMLTHANADTLRDLQSKLYPYMHAFVSDAFDETKALTASPYPYIVLNNKPGCAKQRSIFTGIFRGQDAYLLGSHC